MPTMISSKLIPFLYNHSIIDLKGNSQRPFQYMCHKKSSNIGNMAVVSSVFGTKCSQKELKIIPISSDKRLP